MKWVKFGVSRHFLEHPLRKWPGILHADNLEHLQNWIDYGHSLLIFLILALFWLREMGQIWGFGSCSVDFPRYGDIETGHIWGLWALSGELVGVNVEGERRHISDTLRQVLSSFRCLAVKIELQRNIDIAWRVGVHYFLWCRLICLFHYLQV